MAQSHTGSESLPGNGGVDRRIQEAVCFSSINRKNDQQCLVGAPEPLQEMQSFDAGRRSAGQEEEPGLYSRGAEARADTASATNMAFRTAAPEFISSSCDLVFVLHKTQKPLWGRTGA